MKNLVHTPCQMVVQDPDSGHTLIAVFHDIKMQFPPGTEIPSNAVIPRDWAIFSKWEVEKEEEEKEYVLMTEIFWPDGSPFTKLPLSAKQPIQSGMAFIVRLNGFPMGQAGKLRITSTLTLNDVAIYDPLDISLGVLHQFDLSKPSGSGDAK